MKRFLPILIIISLLLCGCSGVLSALSPNTYSVITERTDENSNKNSEIMPAESKEELRECLIAMIKAHVQNGIVHLSTDYPGDAAQDATDLAYDIWKNTPLGAFSIDVINVTCDRLLSYYEIAFTISYRVSPYIVSSIRPVEDETGIQAEIERAMEAHISRLILSIEHYPDAVDYAHYVQNYFNLHSETCIESPEITVSVFPENGENRIIDISLSYQHSASELYSMKNAVADVIRSAQSYVQYRREPMAKAELLYTWLKDRFDYVIEASPTPIYSLLCEGICTSKAFADIFSILCNNCDIDCITVAGYVDGQPYYWNILTFDKTSYHFDILRSINENKYTLQLLYDDAFKGYSWDHELYPACIPPAKSSQAEQSKHDNDTPEEQPDTPEPPEEPVDPNPETPDLPQEPDTPSNE